MRKIILILVIVSVMLLGSFWLAIAQEDVGNKICPVGNEKIVENSKATYEYNGKIYSFCCPMCIDEFKRDPDKYAAKAEQDAGSAHSTHEDHHH